jgi:hypothetical protein
MRLGGGVGEQSHRGVASTFLFFFPFFSPFLDCPARGEKACEGGAREKLTLSLVGTRAIALVGCVFFAYVDAWNAHVLPRVPARIFLLWV